MSITVVSLPVEPRFRVLKGSRKPHTPYQWTVTVLYRAGGINRRLTLKPTDRLFLTQLSPLIDNAVDADREVYGEVTNLRWTAISR